MPYYLAEIRFNKSRTKRKKKKKNLISFIVTLIVIFLLISAPVTLFSATVTATEPPLESALNNLGFTNIALEDIETFPSGMYNITLMAEFAGYRNQNVLSYYMLNTSDFQSIFSGPEGATGDDGGYVDPPLSKIFAVDNQFGISLLSPDDRYYTQHKLNGDYPEQHAKVFKNLDNPDILLIGFENKYGEYDRDYNDMIFSMLHLCPPEIDNVIRTPETPNYNQLVTVTAQVIKGRSNIESVLLKYQVNQGSWINISMSLDNGFYTTDIPAQPFNTTVNYKVYISDIQGLTNVSALYSYTVGDFVPPTVSIIDQVPNQPEPNETVIVSAKVTEPVDASGVKDVTLSYAINAVWSSVKMTLQSGVWKATIPGQSGGVNVQYFVKAFDNAENIAKTSSSSYTTLILNRSPIIVLMNLPSVVFTGEDVDFDASTSYDPDGIIISYLWDFGDGNTSSGATVIHSYLEDGEYMVSLRAIDNEGFVGNKVVIQVVKNRDPVAVFTETAAFVEKEQTLTFDASPSYDVDGTIISYLWDFGDGTSTTGISVSHSYSQRELFQIKLTITDNDGATDTAIETKNVWNKSPVAIFTETVDTGNDRMIAFDSTESYDPDGAIVSYLWDFGDANMATGVTATHVFDNYGLYVVTLTVTDNNGASDSAYSTKNFHFINIPPVASFIDSAETFNIREEISFDASNSYDIDGKIVSYLWDFGDGNTATGVIAKHTFAQDGTYVVTLTVTDNNDATDSISAIKTVKSLSPVALFTQSTKIVSSGESVHFDASASYDLDGTIVSYLWDFGDRNTTTGVMVDYEYEDNGEYTVTLIVIDDNDLSSSVTATQTVMNTAPVAAFTANATTVIQNEMIHFDASESYDSDGTIVSYLWEFGDGNTATGVTTDHAYNEEGEYIVILTVKDNDGDSSIEVVNKVVEAEVVLQLGFLSVIGLGITTLTATLLYGLFIKRKKKTED
ncbi:PKD domain-containing protein [Thermoproteota archaeon]